MSERATERAADVARDLDVPPIVATHYGVPCRNCGQLVPTTPAGLPKPHTRADNGEPCKSRLCAAKYCTNLARRTSNLCTPHVRELERLTKTSAPAA